MARRAGTGYRGPSLAVDAILVRGGNVLLVRRGRPPFKGLLALPGGFVELGETVEQAVVREVHEETGIVSRIIRIHGVYSDPARDPRGHTVSIVFVMERVSGDARGGDDAAAAEWVPLSKLPKTMAFDHAGILADFSSS